MYLVHLAATLAAVFTSGRVAAQTSPTYGYWKLSMRQSWSPTGKWSHTSTHCEYYTPTGALGGIVYCADDFSAEGAGRVVTPCNDTSFSVKELTMYDGGRRFFFFFFYFSEHSPNLRFAIVYTVYLHEVKQTVKFGEEMVALVGRKNITKTRSAAGTDLSFIALIDAKLGG